jgi:TonB family protein
LAVLLVILGSSFCGNLEVSAATPVDLKKEARRYEGKLLLLSAPSRFDLLHFDAHGHPTREAMGEPWTMAGLVRARKIDLRDRQITIEGERAVVALQSDASGSKLVAAPVGRAVHITLDMPPIQSAAELKQVLSQVFSEDIPQKIAGAWRADVDLNSLAHSTSLPADGKVGTLANGRAVYAWQSGVVTQPKAYYKPGPTYAANALLKRISGVVQVRVIVNERGFPEILEVIRHLPEGLDAGVLAAVSQWRFKPGIREGVPTPTVVIVEINFHLQENAKQNRPRK